MAADQYPNINFPSVDFSWLGNLPKVAEGARVERLRQSLGDLKMDTPAGLEKAAGRLMAGGDIEGAVRAYTLANQRRAIEQKGASDAAYLEWLKKHPAGTIPGGPVTEPAPEPFVMGPGGVPVPRAATPATVTPPPPSSVFDRPPAPLNSVIGPQGALPRPQPGSQTAEAPPEPESPSNALITAAQQGQMPSPPFPGPQLAQAGGNVNIGTPKIVPGPPKSDVTVAPTAPAQLPSWLEGAQKPAFTQPPVPAGVPPTGASVISRPTDRSSAIAETNNVLRELATMGPRAANSPEGAALMARLRNALQVGKATQAESDYALELAQRAQRGEPFITQRQFRVLEKTAPDTLKEAQKVYLEQETTGNKARDIIPTLDRIDQIVKDPNFQSGSLANHYETVISGIAMLAKLTGKILPPDWKESLNRIADPHLKAAALISEFNSIANSSVLASAGSLAKGFSEGDRTFTERIMPSILATPDGIARVSQYLRAMAIHHQEGAKAVRKYMDERHVDATPQGVYNEMQRYFDEHPLFADKNGVPTALGRQFNADAGSPLFASEPPKASPFTRDEGRTDARARGGPVAAGHPYVVGEKGPETFVPQTAGVILPHHEGKVFFHSASGRPAGRIRGGKPVFFGRR